LTHRQTDGQTDGQLYRDYRVCMQCMQRGEQPASAWHRLPTTFIRPTHTFVRRTKARQGDRYYAVDGPPCGTWRLMDTRFRRLLKAFCLIEAATHVLTFLYLC